MKYKKMLIPIILINLLFIGGIFFYFENKYQDNYLVNEIREKSNYNFINPLLECNTSFKFFDTNDIEDELQDFLDKNKMKFSDISYYFRLLKNGSTFGYNEKKEFIPASLIKMPLAIAYFKLSESNPELLKKKVLIDKINFNVGKRNIGEDKINIGNTYTIYELIENMLINSDNTATVLLFDYIGEKKIKEVYSELGLKNIDFHNPDSIKISSKDYSSFFRILYNSSYLNRNSSEEILSILSKSSFKIGLRALLPKDLTISNKFGERGTEKINETQLHDCGIMYMKDNPYILCVMTKGNNLNDLSYIIENISKIIFDDISKK